MPHLQNPSAATRDAAGGSDARPRFKFRIITVVPSEGQHALDRALEETFPASDPVSITITEVVRVLPEPRDVN